MGTLRIDYRRTGGFAGIEIAADLAADQLPPPMAELAARLLTDPALGAPVRSAVPGGADHFGYQLRLTDGSRQHTFQWTDFTVPNLVRPLLSAANQVARPTG
jgi:hypothetical protein